jgi:NAD(P)-dependent dehydrogenase (short-subunit alcohol dehydrogenase family)
VPVWFLFGSELSARRYRGSWTNWTGLLKAKEAESIPAERQIGSGAANIPLGRMAQPEEIAAAMLFLASEDNSFAAGSDCWSTAAVLRLS